MSSMLNVDYESNYYYLKNYIFNAMHVSRTCYTTHAISTNQFKWTINLILKLFFLFFGEKQKKNYLENFMLERYSYFPSLNVDANICHLIKKREMVFHDTWPRWRSVIQQRNYTLISCYCPRELSEILKKKRFDIY